MKKFIVEVDEKKSKAVEKLLSSMGATVSEHQDSPRALKADLQADLELLTEKNETLEIEKAQYLQMEKEFETLKLDYTELQKQYELKSAEGAADTVDTSVKETVNPEEAGTLKEGTANEADTITSTPLEEAKGNVKEEAKTGKSKTAPKKAK